MKNTGQEFAEIFTPPEPKVTIEERFDAAKLQAGKVKEGTVKAGAGLLVGTTMVVSLASAAHAETATPDKPHHQVSVVLDQHGDNATGALAEAKKAAASVGERIDQAYDTPAELAAQNGHAANPDFAPLGATFVAKTEAIHAKPNDNDKVSYTERELVWGDTLNQIGREVGVSPSVLAFLKGIPVDGTILAGDVLLIPHFKDPLYVVQEGDTLSSIAEARGLPLARLIEANALTVEDPDVIFIDQKLNLPSTSEPTPATALASKPVGDTATVIPPKGSSVSEYAEVIAEVNPSLGTAKEIEAGAASKLDDPNKIAAETPLDFPGVDQKTADAAQALITAKHNKEVATTPNTLPAASPELIAAGARAKLANPELGVASNGFVFPLLISKDAVINDPDALKAFGRGWCATSQNSCHHDYNAADIFAPTGTVIVAPRGGVIITAHDHDDSKVGSRVTLRGDDGIQYYMAHMGDGTVKVTAGQRVEAGQPIGNVGQNIDAVGTTRHLHFDMLDASKYSQRPACSGARCDGYGFINPQPLLVEAFNNLGEAVPSHSEFTFPDNLDNAHHIPNEYKQAIIDGAKVAGVSPAVFAAQLFHESNFNKDAESGAGAEGISQLMPGTAKDYHVTDRRDPFQSMRAQGEIMRDYMKLAVAVNEEYGSHMSSEDLLHYTLMAYNWGPNAMAAFYDQHRIVPTTVDIGKTIHYGKGTKTFSEQTATYPDKILATARLYGYQG